MDVASHCCPICNSLVMFDSLQLNRVEFMLATLLQVVTSRSPFVDTNGVDDKVKRDEAFILKAAMYFVVRPMLHCFRSSLWDTHVC